MTWTQFWDMHSGGGTKEHPYDMIYIEAPEAEAKVVFYNRFGHNPERVSCTCCGEDYSISEYPSLIDATGYHRNCANVYFFMDDDTEVPSNARPSFNKTLRQWEVDRREVQDRYIDRLKKPAYGAKLMTLEEYLEQSNVLAIHADEIKKPERQGSVPEQGYVWAG